MTRNRPAAPAAAARPPQRTEPFIAHCLDLLGCIGSTRARRMFGGHGLYADELFVALIAAERLYLKVDAATEAQFAAADCEPFIYEGGAQPVRMGYWTVPAEAMESPALMLPWARLAQQAALAARAARPERAGRIKPGAADSPELATSARSKSTAKNAAKPTAPRRRPR